MAINLMPLWDTRCHYDEGQRWLEETLARGSDLPIRPRAHGFWSAAWLAIARGEHRQAVLLIGESLRLFRDLKDSHEIAGSLGVLALASMQLGEYTRAEIALEECLRLHREGADISGEMGALHLLSEVALDRGEYERAVELAEASVTLARRHGRDEFLVHNLDNLARALLLTGDLARAVPLWDEGLRRAATMRDLRDVAYHLEGMAAVAAHRGMAVRAARLAGAATALRKEIHSPLSRPEAAILARLLAPVQTLMDERAWIRAQMDGQSMSWMAATDFALDGIEE
jgi:tetratricopeptide (TPR) repeat protein